ncbi:hypothetical protein IMZ48_25190 [Candidatus Bathyarchaeota archaeon]|nr:hypothetical protein [Candidatus Bathyarchaeota archaeon]
MSSAHVVPSSTGTSKSNMSRNGKYVDPLLSIFSTTVSVLTSGTYATCAS